MAPTVRCRMRQGSRLCETVRITAMHVAVPLVVLAWLFAACAMAAEIVFLQDGRVIQADKVETVGDTVRIEKPAETIELPRSAVLAIHPSAAPRVSPGPADVYRDTTRDMNDKVRREIESRPAR